MLLSAQREQPLPCWVRSDSLCVGLEMVLDSLRYWVVSLCSAVVTPLESLSLSTESCWHLVTPEVQQEWEGAEGQTEGHPWCSVLPKALLT